MTHAQKPDFVFRVNGRVHLNRRGSQFSRLLAAEVCATALVMLDTPRSEVVWEYWLPTPFASFPFTSPPVRHSVPPHSERSILHTLIFANVLLTQHRIANSRKALHNLCQRGSANIIRCPQCAVTDSKETQIWVLQRMHLNGVTSKQARDNLCGKRGRCVSLFLQTTIYLKNAILWHTTLRSLLKTDLSFAGIYCLQLQDIYQRLEGTYCLRLPESGGNRDVVGRLVNFNQVTWSHVP